MDSIPPHRYEPGAHDMLGDTWMRGVLITLALCTLLALTGLGTGPIHHKGEAREAMSVRAVAQDGAWILPWRGDHELPSKPPLYHWLAAITALVLGTLDERAMRLPSALLATAATLAIYARVARRSGPAAALLTVVVLTTSWRWFVSAREARVDMTLAACTTGCLLAAEAALARSRVDPMILIAAYGLAAAAVLAKGPVGLALPVLTVLAYLFARGEMGRVRLLRPVRGLALTALLAGVWYALATWQGGWAFVERQILWENLARMTGSGTHVSHPHPVWYFLWVVPLEFLPWTLVLLLLVPHLWITRRTLDERGLLYPLLWLVVVIAFYSLSAGKRAVYVLPAYPAAAILVGVGCAEVAASGRRHASAVLAVLAGTLAGLLALVGTMLLVPAGARVLGDASARLGGPEAFIAARLLGTQAAPTALWLLASAGGGMLLARALRAGTCRSIVTGLGLTAVAVLAGIAHVAMPAVARSWSVREFAAEVRRTVAIDDDLAVVGERALALEYYVGRPMRHVRHVLPHRLPPASRHWVLVWEPDLRAASPAEQAQLTVTTAGPLLPDGRRLLLARLRPQEPVPPA